MTTLQFFDTPDTPHQVQVRTDAVYVDGTSVLVRKASSGNFITTLGGRSERLRAVAHGDTIYVQLRGRSVKVNRVDPTRAAASGAAGAPVLHMRPCRAWSYRCWPAWASRSKGEALLVIESMKLQMTISATLDGEVAEMPLVIGQSFQRNDMLVRLQTAGETA